MRPSDALQSMAGTVDERRPVVQGDGVTGVTKLGEGSTEGTSGDGCA